MKKSINILGLLFSLGLVAQTGVKTTAPTEKLDVNATVRLRTLPKDGDINAINTKPDGTKSTVKDQTFVVNNVISADKNGVIGKSEVGKAMLNTNTEGYEISKRVVNISAIPTGTNLLPVAGTEYTCGDVQMAWGKDSGDNWYVAIRLAAAPTADLTIPISFEQQYDLNGQEFEQQSHIFTVNTPPVVSPATAASVLKTRWNTYQSYYYTGVDINGAADNELNNAYFIYPGKTDYYRIAMLKTATTVSMVCTRF